MSSDAQTRNEQGSSNPQLPPYPDALGHPLTHSIRTMHKPLMFRDNLCKHHDVSRSYFFGAGDIYNLSHPKLFKRVLIDNRESFGKSDDFRIAFGEGLVASEGGQWQQQRQILQPLFTQNKIDSYISGMTEQIHRRADSWESGMTIDLQREMRRLTLDTLFATLFGRKLALEGDSDIHNAAVQLHDWFTPTSYPLPEWVPTPARRRFKRGRSKLRTIAGELLSKKASAMTDNSSNPDDLLSTLVNLREQTDDNSMLTDKQLRDQIVTLIFAGHDTTASTLALALYELSRDEDLQSCFHDEIDNIETPIDRVTLNSLPVTDQIVTETLRMYPAVYVIPSIAERERTMMDYRIPNQSHVWLGVRQVQTDERFYESPDTFDPSRWEEGIKQSIPDFAFAPFGGGPRFCIGRQFALTEAKLALAIIGRKYTLHRIDHSDYPPESQNHSNTPDPPLTADMTLRLTPGTEFYLSER